MQKLHLHCKSVTNLPDYLGVPLSVRNFHDDENHLFLVFQLLNTLNKINIQVNKYRIVSKKAKNTFITIGLSCRFGA